MFNALSDSPYVVNTISPIPFPFLTRSFWLSNTNQTGTTCGLPSFLTVASFAVNVPYIRNFSTSFLDISVIISIMFNFLKAISHAYYFSQRSFCYTQYIAKIAIAILMLFQNPYFKILI